MIFKFIISHLRGPEQLKDNQHRDNSQALGKDQGDDHRGKDFGGAGRVTAQGLDTGKAPRGKHRARPKHAHSKDQDQGKVTAHCSTIAVTRFSSALTMPLLMGNSLSSMMILPQTKILKMRRQKGRTSKTPCSPGRIRPLALPSKTTSLGLIMETSNNISKKSLETLNPKL